MDRLYRQIDNIYMDTETLTQIDRWTDEQRDRTIQVDIRITTETDRYKYLGRQIDRYTRTKTNRQTTKNRHRHKNTTIITKQSQR